MKRFIVIGAIAAVLAGCFEKEPADDGLAKSVKAVSEIEAANNSPDNTVKSWWTIKDASGLVRTEICKSNLKAAAPYLNKLSQISADAIVNRGDCGKLPPSFDRQILKVEVQSDTRAVVTTRIKNVTPPEDGAALDDADKKAKEAGEPFRYLLERKDSKSGWKITNISSFPSYANDWQDINEKSKPSNNKYVYGAYQ